MSRSTGRIGNATTPARSFERAALLAVNGGSSSLKFALYDLESARAGSPRRMGGGRIECIGRPDARMSAQLGDEQQAHIRNVNAPDLGGAADVLIDWLEGSLGCETIAVVGFRIVHGGQSYREPERVTPTLIAELRRIIPLDEDHLPGQIALIERIQTRLAGVPAVACFDTGFHHEMPRVAKIVPIPRKFEAAGVERYGFHGLSYAFLMEEIARVAGADAVAGRIIMAHLGSGASLAAVRGGCPVDTTMGLTPASGLVMSTRCGDIDPGLFLYLTRMVAGMSAEVFHRIVNHESGLLGVSETSADIRDLLARRADDERAAEAVQLFCYQAKKGIGALAAALGGMDLLVFSGGIGENSPDIRAETCAGLDFLGITIDPVRNRGNEAVISTETSRTPVRVIQTDEESMIARYTSRFVSLKE
jgi:acetate kinase